MKKTKIVDIDRCDRKSEIQVDGETVECLESFEYLGSKISGNGKCSDEIKRRSAMALAQMKKLEKVWKGQDRNTKIKIIRTCIFPTAIYGCEGWTISKTDEKKITSFEMKCYRKMLRIPWTAKRKNEDILKELQIPQDWLLNTIKARKLSYFGHMKRHDSLEKHILEAKLEGKRRRGRPTRRWTDDIRDWMSTKVTTVGMAAQNRKNFRSMVREVTSTTATCQDK